MLFSIYGDSGSNLVCFLVCKMIDTEMKQFVKLKASANKSKKKFKHNKPYWNNDLTMAWKK